VIKLLILANCQSAALASILEKVIGADGRPVFSIIPIKPTYEVTVEDCPYLEQCLQQCDVLLYQPHIGADGGWRTSDRWLEQTTAKAFSFQSLYFSAYNPELTYLRDKINRHLNEGFVDYHDKRIVKLFLAGYSEGEITSSYQKIQPFPEDVESFYQATLAEMKTRELEQGLDIKVSAFVEENFRITRLFYTYNHPANVVLYEVVRQLLDLLGREDLVVPKIKQELLRFDDFPIADKVREGLRLTFKADDSYLVQGKKYSRQELVARYIAIYKEQREWVSFAARKLSQERWLNRKKVIFHIGQSKTATTSFQSWAFKHQKELLAENVLYPNTGMKFTNHIYLAQHYQGVKRDGKLVQLLKAEITNSAAEFVIISCEAFEGLNSSQVTELLADFNDCEVHVFCQLRERVSWAQSMYSEWVKKSWLHISFSELISYCDIESSLVCRLKVRLMLGGRQYHIVRLFHRMLADRVNLKHWRDMMNVQNFHPLAMASGGLLSAVVNKLSLRIEIDKFSVEKKLNPGPTLLAIEIARRFFIDHKVGELLYPVAVGFLQRVDKELLLRNLVATATTPFESLSQVAKFLGGYIEDDAWLVRTYGFSRQDLSVLKDIEFIDVQLIDRHYLAIKDDVPQWFKAFSGDFSKS
jgi:hypothetical protein